MSAGPGSLGGADDLRVHLPFTEFTLDNGLRVVVHEDRRTPLACVDIWYHVGSRNEVPGRTGFAHLFEHLMFEGSEHVPSGRFDELLENVGGINNGSTSQDRTDYWELVPAHAVDLALYLEADRMAGLLHAVGEEQLEAQRGVVMNERRQSYENRPYGMAWETLQAALYPEGHPYRWPVIGYMDDIAAATLADVQEFFATWYTPDNATLVVAGDVNASRVQDVVRGYFGDIAPGRRRPRAEPPALPVLDADQRVTLDDDVTLARIYMAWHSPAAYDDGDAALDVAAGILGSGRASRLYRRLVYESQVAQSVSAWQSSALLGSTFHVVATARPGTELQQLEDTVRDEIAAMAGAVRADEVQRARNALQTDFIDALQSVGGFGGRADQLNTWLFHLGTADYAGQEMARYSALTPERISSAVSTWLCQPAGIVSVVPARRRA
ncbi:MAG TPA: pitrilysin family protein [Longimicrobiales bacterium]|nr:pitrilysin family protein [Longimicrobiales bacterium]